MISCAEQHGGVLTTATLQGAHTHMHMHMHTHRYMHIQTHKCTP